MFQVQAHYLQSQSQEASSSSSTNNNEDHHCRTNGLCKVKIMDVQINKARGKFEELQGGSSVRELDEFMKGIRMLKSQIPQQLKIHYAYSNPHRNPWPSINKSSDEMETKTKFLDIIDSADLWQAYLDLPMLLKNYLLCFFLFPEKAVIKRRVMLYLWMSNRMFPYEDSAILALDVLIRLRFIEHVYQKWWRHGALVECKRSGARGGSSGDEDCEGGSDGGGCAVHAAEFERNGTRDGRGGDDGSTWTVPRGVFVEQRRERVSERPVERTTIQRGTRDEADHYSHLQPCCGPERGFLFLRVEKQVPVLPTGGESVVGSPKDIHRSTRDKVGIYFVYKNPQEWYLRDGSDGCVRATKLNGVDDGFLVLKNMKLPESSAASVDGGMCIEACR
ncbi:hypothetical protein Acr_15g0017620 [Actinidia rufa]|uniref:Uncharacterized protein n=1 Tax=Actinidia rufa TaxID=165716 RepID=A0A7J0FX44_9ERIC|nr:hypothetical protein Acr_15g0017620 [Actinidia rufa]